MRRRLAVVAIFLQAPLLSQTQPPSTAPAPSTLKSAAHAVQLHVFVNNPAGNPVHGLLKSEFVLTDNGHPRDVRIFAGEIDASQTAAVTAMTASPDVYSNRLDMGNAPIVTAVVIDAVRRPDGLQQNSGMFGQQPATFWFNWVRAQALVAIRRMQPGQTMAIFAVCPDLRVVQDFTSDAERLTASMAGFVLPSIPDDLRKKKSRTVDDLAVPMLSGLRDVTGRMSGASGRKSVVLLSQGYGAGFDLSAIEDKTDATVAALNDANVPLYAVDTRFSPTCISPRNPLPDLPGQARVDLSHVSEQTCYQQTDISDKWMEYLARETGGRGTFKVGDINVYESPGGAGGVGWRGDRKGNIVDDALRFALDDARYAYEMGFYVPESELDGKVHTLKVTTPANPNYELRYRTGYTASGNAIAPPEALEPTGAAAGLKIVGSPKLDRVGIDAKIETDPKAKNTLRVSVALDPQTITRGADGVIVLDGIFTQTDIAGKQVAKIQEPVRTQVPASPTEMVRFSRDVKLNSGAAFLRVTIRDQATNRVGSITIPIEQR
jgi:VWFA-related protein